MALYIIPLLIIVLFVLFILRRGKKNKKTGPTEEEFLAQVLKDVDQSKEEQGSSVEKPEKAEELKEPNQTAEQHVAAKTKIKPPKEQLAAKPVKKSVPTPVETDKPVPPSAPVAKPKPAPAKAKKRFTPSNPLIKQYETHLNLEMLRAQKEGDEAAYIDIVRKNSVYMKNCTLLNKALAEKDKEKALASLKKIREMIPKDFRP